MCEVLGPAGFEVLEAVDGNDALRQLSEHEAVSLVLLDVNLPDKSGLQILRELRAREEHGPAVVMVTIEASPRMLREAQVAGARAWLVKPFDPGMLLAAAKKFST